MTSGRPAGWQFSRAATLSREVTARLFGPVVRWWVRGPRVTGVEHLDELDGPALICPTHSSHLDFSTLRLALGSAHRRRLAPAVAADYFATNRVRWFFAAWLGAFAFERHRRGATDSFAAAAALLAAGWSIVIFPEGTRSRTGEIGSFKPGAAFLASRTGVPVLPVRIVGIRQVLPPGSAWPRRGQVDVRFGAPLRLEAGEDVRAFTARLEAAVRAL